MKFKKLMLLFACLLLIATAAVAKDAPTVTRIDPADLQEMTNLTRVDGDGFVGNLNPVAWAITDWVLGNEGYKYLFTPAETLPDCQVGFSLLSVHIFLQFGATLTYPVEFNLYGDLESAVFDEVTSCYIPGPEECVGPVTTITIGEPGAYDIEVPMDCQCAYIYKPDGTPYKYFLSVHFIDEILADLLTDNFPVGCTSYNDWNDGEGWRDLAGFGFPGEISMYGDVNCCTEPVAVEEKTWGDIKSLFR